MASINRVQVGKLDPHDPLCGLDYPSQISSILCSAAGIPHCHTVAKNAFYCTPVEIFQKLRRYFSFFKLPQEEKPLLSFFITYRVLTVHVRSFVIYRPRNLMFVTCPTSVPFI